MSNHYNLTAKILLLFVSVLVIGITAPEQIPGLGAQTASTEIVASSIDGGGGEMSGSNLSMEYAVAESQPIGQTSSANFTLDSGFIPIIAEQEESSSPPVSTPVQSVPTLSFWSLLVLCGIIVILSIKKRRLA